MTLVCIQHIIKDRVIGHIVNTPGGKRRQILGSVIKQEQKYRQQPAWGRKQKGRRMERERERGIEEEEESKATLGDCGRKREREREKEERQAEGGRQN